MPELPEVETVRRNLEESVVGARVTGVEVPGRRSVRRQSAEEFSAGLRGARVAGARRHGKYLLVELAGGGLVVVHLRMSGQLRLLPAGAPRAPHTHVVLHLEHAGAARELHFVDPRTFGELFLADPRPPRALPAELAGLGLDPLTEGVSADRLGELLAGRRTSLKAVLLDQRAVAGIGNLYADEICFRARLRPDRPAARLRAGQVARLAAAIDAVLAEAVEARGSSLRDERYRDLFGDLGGYQRRHAVYARSGEPCPSCGRPIRRARVAGRSAHFCATCQR